MKKRITFILALTAIITFAAGSAFGKYSGGTGEPNDPYQIADVNDLLALSGTTADYGKCFVLTADINLTSLTFTQPPIAPDTNNAQWNGFQGTQFTGIFDGDTHTISNLTITASTQDIIGLFGFVGDGGQIKNLGVENVNITGRNYVGSLVGINYGTVSGCHAIGEVNGIECVGGLVGRNDGTVSGCYATGSVSATGDYVAGLVGINGGSINNCYSTADVNGAYGVGGLVGSGGGILSSCYAAGSVNGGRAVGGLVGYRVTGTVSSCYATGPVSGEGSVGGLVGRNDRESMITNCYAAGVVTATDGSVGGLAGINDGTISSCYATGPVSGGTYNVGGLVGLVGYMGYGQVSNCYATGSVRGNQEVGGLVGGIGWWVGGSGTVRSCYAAGDVNGTYDVGGLVGINGGSISDCYSIGDVNGQDEVGGLVGDNDSWVISCYSKSDVNGIYTVGGLGGKNDGTVLNCYAVGSVIGKDDVGGLVGFNSQNRYIRNSYSAGPVLGNSGVGGLVGVVEGSFIIVTNCIWNSETSNQTTGVGYGPSDSVYGRTTDEMKYIATFTDYAWDFVNETINGTDDVWRMCADGVNYPKLYWQYSLKGDLDCPDGVGWEDLLYISQRWLQTTNPFEGADITGDSVVNFQDYAVLPGHWLEGM